MSDPSGPPFAVLVFDMDRTGEPDGEHLISGFVCHDVKFGGDAAGVFAWPEEPVDWALRTMQFLLMADTMAMRGDGPDWANDCDVLSLKVTETDAAPDYPLD